MRPYLLLGLYLFPFLLCILLINNFSPARFLVPAPYSSSIIAFEFATSYEDVLLVLSPLTQDDLSNLDMLNYVDFGFMICYSLLLISFLSVSKHIDSKNLFFPGSILILLIWLSDLIETITLLNISDLYRYNASSDLFNTPLLILYYSTWSKWLCLALCFVLFGYILLSRKDVISRISAVPMCFPMLLALPALLGRPFLKDIFANSIFGAFSCLILYCLIYKYNRSSKQL